MTLRELLDQFDITYADDTIGLDYPLYLEMVKDVDGGEPIAFNVEFDHKNNRVILQEMDMDT